MTENELKALEQEITKAENAMNTAQSKYNAAGLELDKARERYFALCDALALLKAS